MTHPPHSLEQLVEEFLTSRRAGSRVDARSFAARHPQFGLELVDALESAEMLESAHAELRDEAAAAQGELLGAFRVVREVGRGGMGLVYEAIEEPLGRRVALKLLPSELLSSAAARARFQREAALAGRLDHPGVCTVYGAGVNDNQPWIAMRLVEGQTLSQLIAAARDAGADCASLPSANDIDRPIAVAACIARVARALASAHAVGVLHRDVKPSNVMVKPDGEPVLLDFGLAIERDSDAANLTRTGDTAGTPAFLAPELISDADARPDAQSDVYSLGVTLFECLTLEPPFRGPTREALYRAVLFDAPADVRRINRAISRDLAVVVATALERDRARRYASAADLAADLECVVARRPIAARPVGALGKLARWAQREPRQALFASGFAAAALALALIGGRMLASRDMLRAAEREQRAREIEAAITDGFRQINAGQPEQADSTFTRLLELDPSNLEALAGCVLANFHLGRLARAERWLEGAPRTRAFEGLRELVARRPPTMTEPAWLDSATPLEVFIHEERLRTEAYRRPPSDQLPWMRQALALSNELIARAPHARAVYHSARAFAAFGARDESAARSAARALLELWPQSAREVFTAGLTLGGFDPAAAWPVLERAVQLDPNYMPAWQNLGLACLRSGELERARSALARAIELDPRDVNSRNALGMALDREQCSDQARGVWLETLTLAPRSGEVWQNLGSLEARLGRFEAAAQAFEIAAALDPRAPLLRVQHAACLKAAGDGARARSAYEAALALAPEDARYWSYFAALLIELSEPREALTALEIARSFDPKLPGLTDLEQHARTIADSQE